jgi:hypothetical protein
VSKTTEAIVRDGATVEARVGPTRPLAWLAAARRPPLAAAQRVLTALRGFLRGALRPPGDAPPDGPPARCC